MTKQYTKAENILIEASSQAPTDLYIRGNLGHTYLLLGDFEEAKKIYQRHINENLDINISFKEMLKKDFDTFKDMGIYTEYFDRMASLLDIK